MRASRVRPPVSPVVVLLALVLIGCSPTGEVLVDADQAAALEPLPDGGLLVGERLTGRILRISATGEVAEVATIDVATDGEQRGLLGLAADAGGAIVFAAYTRASDSRIAVVQVLPEEREVWVGPESRDIANGGHIELTGSGTLVIGLGSLGGDDVIDDPTTLNGKLLALDANGPPDQEPVLIAGGFHNPFAFDVDDAGRIYVGDNSPGDEPERLLVVAPEPVAVAEIEPHTVASGLALLPDGRLAVCTYLERTLRIWRIEGGLAEPEGEPLAEDCLLGVAVLSDGRLAYATETEIRLVAQP